MCLLCSFIMFDKWGIISKKGLSVGIVFHETQNWNFLLFIELRKSTKIDIAQTSFLILIFL